jgi:hypothetical protein
MYTKFFCNYQNVDVLVIKGHNGRIYEKVNRRELSETQKIIATIF